MDFFTALTAAQKRDKWTKEQIAVASGRSSETVRLWLLGRGTPSFEIVQRLRSNWPTFADMIDGKVAA